MVSFGKHASIEKDGKDTHDIGISKNERERRQNSLCLMIFFLRLELILWLSAKNVGSKDKVEHRSNNYGVWKRELIENE